MYNFLRIQFRFGRISAAQLATLIGTYITAEQYTEITGVSPEEGTDNG